MIESPETARRARATLADIVEACASLGAVLEGDGSLAIGGLCQDSRIVEAGDIFAARPGARADGSAFVREALGRGAVAVMVDRRTPFAERDVPVIRVDDIARAIAFGAEAAYGYPSRALDVIGITGTNGKTTVSWILAHAIEAAGGRAARLGTLGFAFGGTEIDTGLTTPEADRISFWLARARDAGAAHFVMETSSHALAQARVDALTFRVAAFTNLTQDHLDYHASMREYFRAKLRLFSELGPARSVINVDDEAGIEIARAAAGRVLRVSRRPDAEAEIRALESCSDARGTRAVVELPSMRVEIETALVGEHNLENLLLVLGVVEALELDVRAAADALGRAPSVPGRLERCDGAADDIVVLVDYAHTPDALTRALDAVRSLSSGSVVCVFGCGGDRDPDKRPKMGEAVARGADRAIVTSDNPRSEDAGNIAAAVERGLARSTTSYEIELDRARAIERAVLESAPGDVVLIAGKGHESHQIVGAERRHFDDREQARAALEQRRQRRVEAAR